ncbi:UDP-glycosyltransferase 73B5 [Apostasia shenzhenica]|uniref:UDP-glycosyltransferase 73B5 n=1 Tax=Apostasia shenzhenica TaxID=1088818 RepID=A0A2I0B7X3_9ASPA|nr:UDP-glycosyltransferase 73B5 [Apostasia shenzhenica]
MAHGHMLPIIDVARLVAAAGVRSTILTTPGVALQVQPAIDLANASLSAPIRLHLVQFPSAAAAAAERKSLGVVVNSFYELEPEYAEYYAKEMGMRAWHIGPVALCNRENSGELSRGSSGKLSGEILRWLDGQEPGSVLYVCFGSLSLFSAVQLREIAVGLEAAGHPFVWVLPIASDGSGWMPAWYEERLEGRGLLIKEWAPQILILNHPAAGGFLTHCGWNSCLEGISAGLPLATWPLFAEQFFNERFLVDVLKVGVALERKELIAAAAVEVAVRRVMGEGEEAEGRRRRAKEAGGKARKAVEKGGSSYGELERLIRELKEERNRRMKMAVGDG